MIIPPRFKRRVLGASLLVLGGSVSLDAQRFEISFARAAHPGPITGRVYVAISRLTDTTGTPIRRSGEGGDPLFAVNVDALAAGRPAIIDAHAFGHPVQSLRAMELVPKMTRHMEQNAPAGADLRTWRY